jgi:hypothetical protein
MVRIAKKKNVFLFVKTIRVAIYITKQLQWYGHVQRMEEGRLPKEVLEWRPSGRRKRGRPKLTWAEGIRGKIGEKGLKEEDWTDRNKWSNIA